MSRSAPSRVVLFVPAVVCLAIALVMAMQLSRALREDLYWTPTGEARGLEEGRDRVEVYLDGELLQRRVASGELRASGRPVSRSDLTLRFNDYERVSLVQLLLMTASGSAGLALLAAAFLLPARRRPVAAELADTETTP